MRFPKLYAIADGGLLRARGVDLREFAEALRAAGVGLVQLRDKAGSPAQVLAAAAVLRSAMPDAMLIMNDRADLAVLARFHGVHVGQEDLGVGDARRVLSRTHSSVPHSSQKRDEWGTEGAAIVGVSTHSEEQVRVAEADQPDYLAVGPVFATGTKLDAEPVVGLEGVRRARALTSRPLVAIGGITRENCRGVIEAGADSVAVISGFFAANETVEQVARDFLRVLN